MTNHALVFLRHLGNSLPATIRNILSIGAGDIAAKLLMFVAFVHVARVLTPDRFGEWNLAIAFSALLFPVVDFGLGFLGTREVAQKPSSFSFYYAHIVLLRTILAGLSFLLLLLILFVSQVSPIVFSLGVLFGFSYFLAAFSATWAYQGMFRPSWFIIDKVSQAGVFAAFVLWFFQGESSLLWLPSIAFVSLAVSTAVLFGGFVRKHFVGPVSVSLRSFARNHASSIFSFFLLGALGQIHITIDYVVVGAVLDVGNVGEFSAAFRIFAVLLIFPNLLWSSFYPLLSRSASAIALWTRCFGIMMKYQWAAVWFFVAIAIWYPGELLSLLYGERYMSSQGLLQILLLALSVSFLSMALLKSLPTIGFERSSLKISLLATGIHIVAAVLLTLERGILGTGIAFLITEIVLLGAAIIRLGPIVQGRLLTGAVPFLAFMVFTFYGSELLQGVLELNRIAGFLLSVSLYSILCVKAGGLSLRQIKELESTEMSTKVSKLL